MPCGFDTFGHYDRDNHQTRRFFVIGAALIPKSSGAFH
jgi:hypothetical protein